MQLQKKQSNYSKNKKMSYLSEYKHDSAIVILEASKQTFLSLAINFGGIELNGIRYEYIKEHDALVQKKYISEIKKHKSFEAFLEHIKKINND